MKKKVKVNPPKLRKGQLCFRCFKEIKKDWCYNGHWWHSKCMDKESARRIKNYLKELEGKNRKSI